MLSFIMTLCYKAIKVITGFLPLKNIIILESSPDFSDNTLAVYNELLEKGLNKKYKLIWILNQKKEDCQLPENVYVQSKAVGSVSDKFKAHWTIARSKFIIDSSNFVHKVHKNQIRIHLKHGMPVKDAYSYTKKTGKVDLICVPSDYWTDITAREHCVSPDKIKPLGFPRNDVLIPASHQYKTIIWMPTFRKNAFDSSADINFDFDDIMPFGLPFIKSEKELIEINKLFNMNSAYLFVRLHPSQDISKINLSEMSNIIICNNDFLKEKGISLYSLLCFTDALITDYSSVYYDYLYLDKPIAVTVPDFEPYKKHHGILFKDLPHMKESLPAVYPENYEELMSFFNDVFSEKNDINKSSRVREKYMGDCRHDSAEQIVSYLQKNFSL